MRLPSSVRALASVFSCLREGPPLGRSPRLILKCLQPNLAMKSRAKTKWSSIVCLTLAGSMKFTDIGPPFEHVTNEIPASSSWALSASGSPRYLRM